MSAFLDRYIARSDGIPLWPVLTAILAWGGLALVFILGLLKIENDDIRSAAISIAMLIFIATLLFIMFVYALFLLIMKRLNRFN